MKMSDLETVAFGTNLEEVVN